MKRCGVTRWLSIDVGKGGTEFGAAFAAARLATRDAFELFTDRAFAEFLAHESFNLDAAAAWHANDRFADFNAAMNALCAG